MVADQHSDIELGQLSNHIPSSRGRNLDSYEHYPPSEGSPPPPTSNNAQSSINADPPLPPAYPLPPHLAPATGGTTEALPPDYHSVVSRPLEPGEAVLPPPYPRRAPSLTPSAKKRRKRRRKLNGWGIAVGVLVVLGIVFAVTTQVGVFGEDRFRNSS